MTKTYFFENSLWILKSLEDPWKSDQGCLGIFENTSCWESLVSNYSYLTAYSMLTPCALSRLLLPNRLALFYSFATDMFEQLLYLGYVAFPFLTHTNRSRFIFSLPLFKRLQLSVESLCIFAEDHTGDGVPLHFLM